MIQNKNLKNTPKKKTLVQKALFSAGQAVARAGKISKRVKLDKVTDLSKKAWHKTKSSSSKLTGGIKTGVSDITRSFQNGFQSLKKDHVPTAKRVENILDGETKQPEKNETSIKDLELESGNTFSEMEGKDIDKEIEKIGQEISEIEKASEANQTESKDS
ncbi:MAG: hypothetical protein HQL27_00100 [Candidatus Omnitrophica bacterium]|nr:hypothetical protein [Candidatus Omnitrophota bacterium]